MSSEPSQPKFTSRLGFIAAAAGTAVGLGNIWKFPHEVGAHGGATFLVVYLACVLLLGYPLLIAELAFGRKMQASLYEACRKAGGPLWRLAGGWMLLAVILIMANYGTISSWVLGYFFKTVTGALATVTEPEAFFADFASDVSSNLLYALCALLPAVYIVQGGVKAGIEKWSKILLPIFCVLLLGLVVYALTLENAQEGIAFYLIPDLSKIDAEVFFTALTHAFYTLSLGFGVHITYGAYMPKTENILQATTLVIVSDTIVAFLAGLFLFPFIFSQQMTPTSGPALVFIVLPRFFQNLGPLVGPLVGGTFFLLLGFAALTTTISFLEVMTVYLASKLSLPRRQAVYLSAGVMYLASLPSLLSYGGSDFLTNLLTFNGTTYRCFDVIDALLDIALLGGCFLFMLLLSFQWQKFRLLEDLWPVVSQDQGHWLTSYLTWMMRYGCPALLGMMLLLKLMPIW